MKKILIMGNGTSWLNYSLADISSFSKIINKDIILNRKNEVSVLKKILFSYKLDKLIPKFVQRKVINRYLKKNEVVLTEGLILIFYDRNTLANKGWYLKEIKKRNKIKLVYMFTNIVNKSGAYEHNFVMSLNKYYDKVYAFDKEDSKKYEFDYHDLLYSNCLKSSANQNIEPCVFYIGKAKDRYEKIIKVYEFLKRQGIKCNFHIVGVSKNDQKYSNEIVYNEIMDYRDVLEEISRSTHILDVIQENSTGITIKTCEAVTYNKKLLTTNQYIKNEPFFDDDFIQVFEECKDIDIQFFKNEHINECNSYFSPIHFLKELDHIL